MKAIAEFIEKRDEILQVVFIGFPAMPYARCHFLEYLECAADILVIVQ
jgi:hypothetical protein